jgi:hypothetical protein
MVINSLGIRFRGFPRNTQRAEQVDDDPVKTLNKRLAASLLLLC